MIRVPNGMEAYALWFVLYNLVEGIEDMRWRGVIDEADVDQFLAAKLADARCAMKAAGYNVPFTANAKAEA